jgi:hypothetical protein
MLSSLRRQYAELVTSGAYVFLLFVGFQLESEAGWIFVLGGIALISLVLWYAALKRLRIITGTPTSRIASAAQGYVELVGDGRFYGENKLISKLRQLPCLWYRYRVEEKSAKDEWRTIDSGESSELFLLDDGSGLCIVDPAGAEIVTKHEDKWTQGSYRYTEWKLIGSDTIYTLGQFKTIGGSTLTRTLNDEVKEVLTEWKQDMPELHRRFDLDGNGELDTQEWMLARQAAKREAEKRLTELRNQADVHFIVRPQDSRLFLISNFDQNKLARKYYFWTWAHIVILFGALSGVVWVSKQSW